jgi:hypothetical protein
METAFSVLVLLVVGVVGYVLSKRSGAAAQSMGQSMMGGAEAMDAANRRLFEMTGYTHAACPGQPMEAQLEYSRRSASDPMAGVHFVRDAQGLPVHYKTSVSHTLTGVAYAAEWFGQCQTSFGLHLIDAKLLGAEAEKANRTQGYERKIEPAYDEVAIAVPAFGNRFRLFTTDPGKAQQWLQQPDTQQRLMALHSVELLAAPNGITLNDPMMDNLRSGSPAQMMAQTPAQHFEVSLAVHQNVAGLLHGLAQATS